MWAGVPDWGKLWEQEEQSRNATEKAEEAEDNYAALRKGTEQHG